MIFVGAGVLIIDRIRSSLLLVYDHTKDYNCCGGYLKYSNHQDNYLQRTASEELYEETRQLISSDLDDCPFVDIPAIPSRPYCLFRCYLLRISCPTDICQQFEQINVNDLPVDNDYHETQNLRFFPLEQFFNPRKRCQSIARDVEGNAFPLNRRVLNVIHQSIEMNLLQCLNDVIDLSPTETMSIEQGYTNNQFQLNMTTIPPAD